MMRTESEIIGSVILFLLMTCDGNIILIESNIHHLLVLDTIPSSKIHLQILDFFPIPITKGPIVELTHKESVAGVFTVCS